MRTYHVTTWINAETNVKRYGIAIDGRDVPVTYPRWQDARDYITRCKEEALRLRMLGCHRIPNVFDAVDSV